MEDESDFTILPSSRVRSMHPQKFGLWLCLISVTMIFVALTSAYIVKKGAGNWEYFEVPKMFAYSSVIIVLSSLSMYWAFFSAKKDNLIQIRAAIVLTTLLGIAFIASQYGAWLELVENGAYFVGNSAGSFIHVFYGVHVAHLLGGIVFLVIVLISAFRYQVHSKRLARIEMCATYWHFLGGIWLYLYIFLSYNN